MNLADAKTRLTVFDLWRHFQIDGTPGKSARCPFHADKTPSNHRFERTKARPEYKTAPGSVVSRPGWTARQ